MLKRIIRYYFRMRGWELVGRKPPVEKYIIIVSPHTSMFDFVIGWMFCYLFGMKVSYLIKKEVFFFPLGPILRWLGGIPVDRSKNRHLAEQMVRYFDKRKAFALIITPEGTRKKVTRLKRGFYRIAERARVPVYMGFIDMKHKKLGVGDEFVITGNFAHDLIQIKTFYRGMQGFHPERFDAEVLK